MVRSSRKIPPRWEDYHALGSIIENTRIFPFKTPLKSSLQKRVFKEKRFTIIDLFRQLAINGRELGLVINCSNTRRYYQKEDIEGMMVEYKGILCPGRCLLNKTDLVDNFEKAVEDFLLRNKDNNLLIGVHCSNGVDRTGYLICNYLIRKLGWSSHQALNAFEYARGHPIERGSYIQALHKADSDRRLKISNFNSDEMEDKKFTKKSKRKVIDNTFEIGAIDPHDSAKAMQQFFHIEQSFKEAVHSTVVQPQGSNYAGIIKRSIEVGLTSEFPQNSPNSNLKIPTTSYQEETSFDMEADFPSDDEEEIDDSSPNINFESMGKIDIREPASKSQQRRMRRQRREKLFSVMKRGRFWEINEMQKQMQK